jgi:RNA polymerase sigma-70 factor, ECF subfamily
VNGPGTDDGSPAPGPASPQGPNTNAPFDDKGDAGFPAGASFAAIMPLVYEELRALAEIHFEGESAGHTLQPTALVHEVYLRMAGQARAKIDTRGQFLALASEAMRRVLVDQARRRLTRKRGGEWTRVTLTDDCGLSRDGAVDALALDRVLDKLAVVDPEAARVVTLRFFGGLTEIETGAALGRSERWVRDQWRFAKAWLRRELGGDAAAGPGAKDG